VDRRFYDSPDPTAAQDGRPRRHFERGAPITISFDGQTVRAYEGEPVAVALFAAGVRVTSRSIKYHRPRSLFCLSGHCNGCLVRADGVPNVKSCREPCKDALEVHGQNAFPSSDLDVLAAVDWLFKKGMDHHTLMTSHRLLHPVMQRVVRQLSGLGTLPTRVSSELPLPEQQIVDVVVVGAGPAGLAAATAAAAAGARTLCVDEGDLPGGSLLADPRFGPAEAARRAAAARDAGVDLRRRASCIAWFPEDEGGLLAVATPTRLVRVKAARIIYATGGYDQNGRFEDNDRPGVFSARAVGRLVVRYGVRPGERVVVAGDSAFARALEAELNALGVPTTRIDGIHHKLVRAHGRAWIEAVEISDERGRSKMLPCDLLAVDEIPAPACEAPRQHGAKVVLDAKKGGFAVLAGDHGQTDAPGVFACGDVTGFVGPEAAAAHGARAGAAAARAALEERGAR
jgi:sarcosine oxidase subunit alpha